MSRPRAATIRRPRRVERRLRTLVSPYVGLVRQAPVAMLAPGDAPLAAVACEMADSRALIGAELVPACGAVKESRRNAFAAAVGEAVERYSASFVPEQGLVRATAADLGDEAVGPGRVKLFRKDQYGPGFPFAPFTPGSRIRWTRGESLAGDPCWLPAQLVYLAAPAADEPVIGHATSSGLACGGSREEAARGGFLELIERDAFLIAWHNRLSLPRIDVAGDRGLCRLATRIAAATGSTLRVVDLTPIADVPTALAIVRGNGIDPVTLAVGAACAPTARLAWTNAVCEAFATRAWARSLVRLRPSRTFERGFADVSTFEDHVHLYALPDHAGYTDFLHSSSDTHDVRDIPSLAGETPSEQLAAVSAILAGSGATGYVVDVTPPDIAAAGLTTVRAFSPELCPLDALHTARFLGPDRLYVEACRRGLRATPLAPDEITPYPHPFP